MHPNGKWVWVASAAGGKGDWRTLGGRTHKKHQAGAAAGSSSTGTSGTATAKNTPSTPKKSSAPKIDTETVDQAIYDKQYNDAMSLKDSSDVSAETSIQFGLSTHKGFLRDTKKKLEETLQNRPGAKATIAKLQKDLTRFVSTTKALEQALVDRKKE